MVSIHCVTMLASSGKRKKSDVKEDEPSTSLDKTESEIRPILGTH